MTRLLACIKIVLGHEGGYVNHQNDRGGATNYGVTQKTYDDFNNRRGAPKRDVKDIHVTDVEAIYGTYWKDAHCAYMPEPLDLLMFDSAINHGAGNAVKMLQRVMGVDADGIAGRDTMRALHEEVVSVGIEALCRMYLDERAVFYDRIIQRDPTQSVFAKGWLARVDHLRSMVA